MNDRLEPARELFRPCGTAERFKHERLHRRAATHWLRNRHQRRDIDWSLLTRLDLDERLADRQPGRKCKGARSADPDLGSIGQQDRRSHAEVCELNLAIWPLFDAKMARRNVGIVEHDARSAARDPYAAK